MLVNAPFLIRAVAAISIAVVSPPATNPLSTSASASAGGPDLIGRISSPTTTTTTTKLPTSVYYLNV